MSKNEGIVYNIQRFNLHDGPGIRTIVFLKGCPLSCLWCSNPESQSFEPEQMGDEVVGSVMTVDEVIEIAMRDRPFFRRSGGGITLSGGEPTAQPEFALAVLKAAKAAGLHTAIETTCYAPEEDFARIIAETDYILADIKSMDSARHKRLTGVPNELILKNLSAAAKSGRQLVVRVPVMPGLNSSWENLCATAEFCRAHSIPRIELLPYHKLGVGKYEKLNRPYKLPNLKPPDKESLRKVARQLTEKSGVTVVVV